MGIITRVSFVTAVVALAAGAIMAQDKPVAATVNKPLAEVSMKISGPGALNDSTIKAGEKVTVDIYWMNAKEQRGFTTGFKLTSPDIPKVIHVGDAATCINPKAPDIKGFNGWNDKSIWDLGGVFVAVKDWDGNLPDTIGFGGAVVKQRYLPHPKQKVLSMEMIVPTPGTLTIDSTFFPPGGKWKFGTPNPNIVEKPEWRGPYIFKVVK